MILLRSRYVFMRISVNLRGDLTREQTCLGPHGWDSEEAARIFVGVTSYYPLGSPLKAIAPCYVRRVVITVRLCIIFNAISASFRLQPFHRYVFEVD